MADEIDFLNLYKRLYVSPDCDLDEFRLAYRRRVSLLHPDHRRGGNLIDARAAERLQQLTVQYDAAIAFERRHGRLPGASIAGRSARMESAPLLASTPILARPVRHFHFVALGVLVLGILLWTFNTLSSREDTDDAQTTGDIDNAVAPALAVGMPAASVREIEGNPLASHGDRWEYGSSWILFEHNQVVDWYSAPSQPLRKADSRPSRANL